MPLRAALLLFLLSACPAAAELFSWHGFDASVPVSERLELVLHHRTRTRHEYSYLDQSRVGSVVRWTAAPRIIPFGGYYFQPQQVVPHRWHLGSRLFAGVEAPFPISTSVRLTTRIAAERFIGTGRPDYNRYRSYLRASFGARTATPWVQHELIAVRQGFHSVRTSGGLRFPLSSQVSAEVGYVFDCRRSIWGGDRHAIVTGLRYHVGRR
jgi:hypothetical protein